MALRVAVLLSGLAVIIILVPVVRDAKKAIRVSFVAGPLVRL